MTRELFGFVPPLGESLLLLALAFAQLELEFFELPEKAVAEALLFTDKLGLDAFALGAAPGL